MGQYEPIVYMCIVSLSIVIFNKLWRKNKQSQEPSYNSNKPQKHFTRYIRDNVKDNLSDFYTVEDFQYIKQKVEGLESENFLDTLPNVALKPFKENDFEYVTQEKELNQLASDIQLNSKVIGIDIEQTNHNSYQGYNCLIQISTLTKNYIIDAIVLHDLLPRYFKPICENENIVKVFYSGTSDLQWLNRDYGIFVVNFFDVHYASMFLEKRKDCSLVGLLDQYCSHKLEKETKKKFQVSDWRKRPLTQEQLNYAILDAHYLIYLRNVILEKLIQNKKHDAILSFLKQMQTNCLKPYEPKPFNKYGIMEYFNQEILPTAKSIRQDKKLKAEWSKEKKIFVNLCKLRDDIARAIDTNTDNVFSIKSLLEISIEPPVDLDSQEIVKKLNVLEENFDDVLKFSDKLKSILKEENLIDFADNAQAKKGQIVKQEKKSTRREVHENKFSLKKNLYENCQVLAPDGEILSFTNHKKIRWYLSKGLAEQIGENPIVIKLKFEPSGREISEMREMNIDKQVYMKRNRVNQCVVCGKQDKLSRHHVVPVIYRQHFPPQLKNHRAHDVLLMCFRCREKAIAEMDKFKIELANTHKVPLVEFDKPKQLKLAAEAIQKILSTYVKFKNAMPQDRRRKLKDEIRREFIIFNSDGLSENARKEVDSLTFKEDGKVKIDQKFIDFFLKIKNSKGLVQKSSNKDFKNVSGKLIVEKLTDEELKKFIDDWRMYFLRVMDPQFLPHDWNLALEQRAKQNQNISQ